MNRRTLVGDLQRANRFLAHKYPKVHGWAEGALDALPLVLALTMLATLPTTILFVALYR